MVTIKPGGASVDLLAVLEAWREFCGDELLTGRELCEAYDIPAAVQMQIELVELPEAP